MKNGKWQAKDVPEWLVLECIKQCIAARPGQIWATFWDMHDQVPFIPEKVLRAKCISMVRRNIIKGCEGQHNCRGDFEIIK